LFNIQINSITQNEGASGSGGGEGEGKGAATLIIDEVLIRKVMGLRVEFSKEVIAKVKIGHQ
jgi:hypothetical protein